MAQLLCCFIPIVRLQEGLYLVGSQMQSLDVDEDNDVYLVERAISLEDYLINFGVIESLKLDKIMHQAGLSFKGVIQLLLRKHRADPGDVIEFISNFSEEVEIQFDEIVQLVKDAQIKQN